MCVKDLIEVHGDGLCTTPLFWDCECENNYIHPASDESCILCGAIREEQPDSRVDEVLQQHIPQPVDLTALVQTVAEGTLPESFGIPY